MTVRELIIELAKVPDPDVEFGAFVGCNGYTTIAAVKGVVNTGIAVLADVESEAVEEFVRVMKTIDEQENREACTH